MNEIDFKAIAIKQLIAIGDATWWPILNRNLVAAANDPSVVPAIINLWPLQCAVQYTAVFNNDVKTFVNSGLFVNYPSLRAAALVCDYAIAVTSISMTGVQSRPNYAYISLKGDQILAQPVHYATSLPFRSVNDPAVWDRIDYDQPPANTYDLEIEGVIITIKL